MGLLLVSERLVHGRMTKRLACVADYIPSAEPNAVEVRAVAAPQTGWATPQYPDLPAVEEHLNLGAQRFFAGFPARPGSLRTGSEHTAGQVQTGIHFFEGRVSWVCLL